MVYEGYVALLSPISPTYKYDIPSSGPLPTATSSQSRLVAPTRLNESVTMPSCLSRKSLAGLPLSSITQRWSFIVLLSAIPDASGMGLVKILASGSFEKGSPPGGVGLYGGCDLLQLIMINRKGMSRFMVLI